VPNSGGKKRHIQIQSNFVLLSVFPWPIIFKPENNKIKLLMENESATQKVLLHIGGYEQSSKQSFVEYLTAKKFV
jgi:hypothetical protein